METQPLVFGQSRPAWGSWRLACPTTHPCLTQAAAALAVGFQDPALVAGAFDTELVLVTLLTALEVLGTVALDLAGVVVGPQFHAQGAGAHDAFARCHRTIVAATPIIQRALVWG